ncbi:MAG: CAP domain-containing protein [Planctomycetaceae bacterium]|nr:CAP domain-containing protein [Planctomycetaceae bacterium]
MFFYFALPSVLSVVFLLQTGDSLPTGFIEETEESVTIEQSESTGVVTDTAATGQVSKSLTLDDMKQLLSSTAKPKVQPLAIDGLVLTDAERQVFELTNAERQKRGLPALRLDRRLMESARRQANWMARTGIFRHGNAPVAENIAMGQRTGREVVLAWLNSSGHFRNMMNRGHGAIGIGSFRGKNGVLYWCQQFSR